MTKAQQWWLAGLAIAVVAAASLGLYRDDRGAKPAPLSVTPHSGGVKDRQSGPDLFLDAKTPAVESVSDLEKTAQSIVIATKTVQHEPTVNYGAEGGIDIAYTHSDFVVDRVIRGTQLRAGETFNILENEAYNAKQDVTYHIAGYTLMDVGAKYLLFLTYSAHDGWYLVQGMNTGKVALDSSGTKHADQVLESVRARAAATREDQSGDRREILENAERDARIYAAVRAKYAAQIATVQ
ncbi:hypothetical protein [Lacticaseibacillus absianus]|uniref:hypothetical protein n=1 Tax=Lacticaseibacillus absianus TaxID=2729623 RepID=UPI0015CD40BC|nr:hypothetical protein [Lacticaseibacillus absianus]